MNLQTSDQSSVNKQTRSLRALQYPLIVRDTRSKRSLYSGRLHTEALFLTRFYAQAALRLWMAITMSLATMHASLYRRSYFVLDMKVLGEKCNIEERLTF